MAGAASAMAMTHPHHTAVNFVAEATLSIDTSSLPSPDEQMSSLPRTTNEDSSGRCTESSERGNSPSSGGQDDTTGTTTSLGEDCVISGAQASSGSDAHERPSKSPYRGVSFDTKKRKWRVQIKVRGSSGAAGRVGAGSNTLWIRWPTSASRACRLGTMKPRRRQPRHTTVQPLDCTHRP